MDHEHAKDPGHAAAPVRDQPNVASERVRDGGVRDALLQLQRVAGNRAVTELIAQRRSDAHPGRARSVPIQRLLATKPSDLDKFITAGASVKGAFGKMSGPDREFLLIRNALADYQSTAKREQAATAKDPKAQADLDWQDGLLAVLEAQCTRYFTRYPQDKKRRAFIAQLLEDVMRERAALGQVRTQKVYQQNVLNAGKASDAFGFQGMDMAAKMITKDLSKGLHVSPQRDAGDERKKKIKEIQKKYEISDAEISAIRIFSAGDYTYINPVTRGSAWGLANVKAKDEKLGTLSDQTLKEEGSLHAAMALQGLAKLPPYKGPIYRGARYTTDEFKTYCSVGHVFSYGQLTSFTSKKEVAYNFAHGIDTESPPAEKDVAVIFIGANAGHDISDLAYKQSEWEVLVPHTAVFEVVSQQKVDGHSMFAEQLAAMKPDRPHPKEWYLVRIANTTKAPTTKPKQPPANTAPQGKSGANWISGGMSADADPANRGVGSGGVKPGLLPLEGGRDLW